MAQIEKLESQVDIKSSAERFFETYRNKPNLFPKMSPNIVKDIQLIKGDYKSVGSVIKWTFATVGNSSSHQFATFVTEAIDEKNNSITSRLVDGDIMKLYNNYSYTIRVTEAAEKSGALVKLTIEYEKQNPNISEPVLYIDAAAACVKNADAYLINNP